MSTNSNNEPKILDSAYFSLAEQIHRDYLEFIKAIVIPKLNKSYDIKLRETRILASIEEIDGPVASSTVAESMRLDPATVTRALIILVGNGLVTTSANFNDRRSRLIELTDKGSDIVRLYTDILSDSIEQARRQGGIIINEDEERQFYEYMTGVRNRASIFARVIKYLKRLQS